MMKKNYLCLAAMATLLSFTACSEDASPLDNGQTPGEVVMEDGTTIVLSVSNTGIGTRAARPVGSSAAANNVNNVQLVFYKFDEKGQWTPATIFAHKAGSKGENEPYKNNIVDFKADGPIAGDKDTGVPGTEGVPGNQSRVEETKNIRLSGLEANTKYRIVAYGYNGNFPYGTPTPDQTTKGLFSTSEHQLSGYNLEEVFAGMVSEVSTKKGEAKFTSAPKVEITRQVAGILAYFKIPTHANGELVQFVKVIANDKSKGFKFPASLLADAYFNGIDNNASKAEEDVLMTFDMSKSASNWKAQDQNDDYYKTAGNDSINNVITNPQSSDNKGLAEGYKAPKDLALEADAFFGARYILPYEKHVNTQTLKVVLCNAAGKAVKTLKVVTNNVPTTPAEDLNLKYNYDIRCNNFYSIGKKLASGNTAGKPDPENPDPNPDPDPEPDPKPEGPDKPVDLGATDQIIVEINDAWDVLHDMDVEE